MSSVLRGNLPQIEDVATDGFTRVMIKSQGESRYTYSPRWSPDGTRFAYLEAADEDASLMLANASGGRAAEIARVGPEARALSWSPDGRWLTGLWQAPGGKRHVAKIKASPGSSPVMLAEAPLTNSPWETPQWSERGILYPSLEGMWIVSPDGGSPRKVSSRYLKPFNFAKDGRRLQHPSRWQACAPLRRQVLLRYLDARRVRSAAQELA
jgi:dipeptidyl aminopeptidase/acylaminoacyl peptidase